jgi:hypothetical protein
MKSDSGSDSENEGTTTNENLWFNSANPLLRKLGYRRNTPNQNASERPSEDFSSKKKVN